MDHQPHDARHTCISMLTEVHAHPTMIKIIAGHSVPIFSTFQYFSLLFLIKEISNNMPYIHPEDITGIYVEKDNNNKPHFNVKIGKVTISNIILD